MNTKGGRHTGLGNKPIYSRAMQYAAMQSGKVRIPGKKPAPPNLPSNPLITLPRQEGHILGTLTDEQKTLFKPISIEEQGKYHKATFMQKLRNKILGWIYKERGVV